MTGSSARPKHRFSFPARSMGSRCSAAFVNQCLLGITGVAAAVCLNAPTRDGSRRSADHKDQGFQSATSQVERP